MSTQFPQPASTIRVVTKTTHERRHYQGDLDELLEHLRQNRRTGVVLVHMNEGFCCKLEFENRVKETKKVY